RLGTVFALDRIVPRSDLVARKPAVHALRSVLVGQARAAKVHEPAVVPREIAHAARSATDHAIAFRAVGEDGLDAVRHLFLGVDDGPLAHDLNIKQAARALLIPAQRPLDTGALPVAGENPQRAGVPVDAAMNL